MLHTFKYRYVQTYFVDVVLNGNVFASTVHVSGTRFLLPVSGADLGQLSQRCL